MRVRPPDSGRRILPPLQKRRSIEQPILHSGQPDRRFAFNIDAHELRAIGCAPARRLHAGPVQPAPRNTAPLVASHGVCETRSRNLGGIMGQFVPVTPLYFRTAELHRKLIDPGPSGAVREIAA